MDMLMSPPLNVFTIIGGIVLGICLIEIVLFLFGGSLSKFFQHDVDVDLDHDIDYHMSHDFDISHDSDIFHLGDVPFIVVLLSLGSFFTMSGFSIHQIANIFNIPMSNLIAIPASIFVSSFLTYWTTAFWKNLFPNEESYVIGLDELLGQEGKVVIGKGDFNNKVQIAVNDKYNQTHYIMVKSALENISFQQDDKVILIEKYADGSYGAIKEIAFDKEINEKEKYA